MIFYMICHYLFLLYTLQCTIPWILKYISFFIKTKWFWMRSTIRIKWTSTSCIYDSKLTCYSVVFIHNLFQISWVQCMCTLLVLNFSVNILWLKWCGGIHEATWHMWRRCRGLLVWIDHSDVLLVLEECTRPLGGTLAVHARSEDVHARHAHTHSLAHTRGYTVGCIFVQRSTPCDNLTRVKSFTSLMVN